MKTKKQTDNRHMTTSVSAGLGSAAGVAVGTMASEELVAADPAVPADEEPGEQPAPVRASQRPATTAVDPEPAPTPTQCPNPEPEPEIEVEVVAYETVTNSDGSQSDVAVLNVNDTPVLLADVDQNGTADLLAADFNQNGELEAEEIIDISDEQVSMQPFAEMAEAAGQAGGDNYYADNNYSDNDLPDYVNDADVSTFMA